MPQDKLGVDIGLDEGTASARISRYETGVHQPPFEIAEKIAATLNVPAAYFYCADEQVAEMLIRMNRLSKDDLLRVEKALTLIEKAPTAKR